MAELTELPLRQKILITITVALGLFTIAAYYLSILDGKILQELILFYGLMVPIVLLSFNTLVDLDNKDVFNIWATVALIFLTIYFFSRGSTRITNWYSRGVLEKEINMSLARSTMKTLKTLPIFLASYWILNRVVKRKTGKFIVNTFRHFVWYNDAAQRKIEWFDVVANMILYGVIICASLIDI